ncbi:MAG: hypothetical protein AB7O62_17065 [Pirellulales bacterium]
MPIEFVCDHCQGLLKVGRRKIGVEVTCPKCGGKVFVPDEVAAGVAVALRQATKHSGQDDGAREFFVYDDPPLPDASAGLPGSGSTRLPSTGQPASHSAPGQVLPPRHLGRATSSRESMLLISRGTLYMQAALFVVLGGFAFLAGYLIGRGREPLPSLAEANQAEVQLLEGSITYKSGAGIVMQDHGAVVIAIPQGKYPTLKWDPATLHPRQPDPPKGSRVMLEMEEHGTRYGRADTNGLYQLAVPKAGRYTLLFISRNARRPTGQEIEIDDLDELRHYFSDPVTDLIGRSKYGLDSVELAAGQLNGHSHDFGMDNQ